MAGQNDILATAGIDLDQFKLQIDALIKELSRAGSAIESTDRKFTVFGRNLTKFGAALIIADFGKEIVTNYTGVNVALGDTSALLQQLNVQSLGVKDAFGPAMTAVENASIATAKKIPIIGGLAAGLGEAAQKQFRDTLLLNKSLNEQAESYDALIAKRQKLVAQKATEEAKPGFMQAAKGGSVEMLNKSIEETDRKLLEMSKKRMELQYNLNAGRDQEIALNDLEIEKKQKLAQLAESLKNIIGLSDKESAKIYGQQGAAIDAEFSQKKRLIEVSRTQELVEKGKLEAIRDTGIEYQDQLRRSKEEIAANAVILKSLREQGLENTLIAAQVAERGRELNIQNKELIHAHELEASQAVADSVNQQAKLIGNKKVADLIAVQLDYSKRIAEANRLGNTEVARQLAVQQKLSELEIKAADLRKKPSQRAAEQRERDKQNQAVRTVVAREKDIQTRADELRKANPRKYAGMTNDEILGRTDSNNRFSRDTARKVAEFAGVQKPGEAGKNAELALQNIKAATIFVTAIKPNP